MRCPFRARIRRLALGALGCFLLGACRSEPSAAPVRVVIPQGATFRAATDSLARPGVIQAPRLFRLYAWATRRDRSIKAGTYALHPGTGWSELLDALTQGRGILRTVTIPEGYAVQAIVPLLARVLEVPLESVEAAVRDSALRHRLQIPTPTLEGYLFPETYSFSAGVSAQQAVEAMVRQFERTWKPEWTARLQELRMTRHQVVTLASIVEKEARLAAERPIIAAVYHNRLRSGMLLQADPTVQYARGQHTTRVLYRDLEIESPYNTYKYAGLPPGPIASPGAASLEATIYPANVPYRFFVAHPEGHHEFHVTFEGHTQARQEVQRARARAGRTRASGSSAPR